MSPDWFDPLGIRGSRLDPFTMFRDAMRGEGPAHQSAEWVATNLAQRLVGRTVDIAGALAITATVDAVEEVRPPSPLDAMSTGATEAPMWARVRGRLRDVVVGEWEIKWATLTAEDLVMVGVAADRLRVGRVEFVATVAPSEVERWAASIDGTHRMRTHQGRIEVTDRRLERWVWLEIGVTAENQSVAVEPRRLRAFGRSLPLPSWARRTITRAAPWMPPNVAIESAMVDDDHVVFTGTVATTVVPVDVAKVLTDLGAEGTMTALRIVTGDW